jgi:hypothetical protein
MGWLGRSLGQGPGTDWPATAPNFNDLDQEKVPNGALPFGKPTKKRKNVLIINRYFLIKKK